MMVLEKQIKDLVELDEKIRARIEKAHQAKVDSKKKVVEDKKNIADATWEEVRKRVVQEKIKLDDHIKSAAADNQREYQEASERLIHLYNENKENWIDELVNNSLKI